MTCLYIHHSGLETCRGKPFLIRRFYWKPYSNTLLTSLGVRRILRRDGGGSPINTSRQRALCGGDTLLSIIALPNEFARSSEHISSEGRSLHWAKDVIPKEMHVMLGRGQTGTGFVTHFLMLQVLVMMIAPANQTRSQHSIQCCRWL